MTDPIDLDDAVEALNLIKNLGQAMQMEKKLNDEYVIILNKKGTLEVDEDGCLILSLEEQDLEQKYWNSFHNVCQILEKIKIFGLYLAGVDTAEREEIFKESFNLRQETATAPPLPMPSAGKIHVGGVRNNKV